MEPLGAPLFFVLGNVAGLRLAVYLCTSDIYGTMRRLLATLLFLLISSPLMATWPPPVEGLWIPLHLAEYNIAEMQSLGCKMSAEEIYSNEQPSLKDAVLWFNGGCTGSVISDQGLVLTNHHCGYSAIQSHSSVDRDLLTDGYWASSKDDELMNDNLEVTFIRRIEPVTDEYQQMEEQGKSSKTITDMLLKKYRREAHYDGFIKDFYGGNKQYLFITETFEDIRLVGAPPSSIGKFGADTDNWMWPRHSGDFALFRIYADKNGKPAKPSEDNVPWSPRRVMKVSLQGVDEGDFTMVFGFPGRTQSKLTSHAVEFIQNKLNPMRIEMRSEVLDVYDKYMRDDKSTFIKYASKQSRVSNAWKKWIGQNRGLKRLNALDKKEKMEQEFTEWVNAKPDRQAKYGQLLQGFESYYERANEVEFALNTFFETFWRVESFRFAFSLNKVAQQPDDLSDEQENELEGFVRQRGMGHFKNYIPEIDQEVCTMMLDGYAKYMPKKYRMDYLVDRLDGKFGGSAQEYSAWLFKKSELDNFEDYGNLLGKRPKRMGRKIRKDPIYELAKSAVDIYREQILPDRQALGAELDSLNQLWYAALMQMQDADRPFYPEANSTMRVSYGQSEDYDAYDAVTYQSFSTIEGVMEKQDTTVKEFTVAPKLIDLYESEDYGQYADDDGTLHVNFIASNHTSGGNSGSPVIDAHGALIGLNFDRNWEGTMSDIIYDKSLVRNISVDIRYILFIIDKYGGANHLIEEMSLSR